MSLLANSNAIESGGYPIQRSLRFRSSASAYLNRTFTTPTSSTIFTWSGWVKRGTLGATGYLFGASTTTNFGFNSSNQLLLTLNGTAAVTTTAVYRDPSSWYHVLYNQNGSAQTVYVNNVSVGTGTTANTVFNTAIAHQIAAANTTNYFDGYLAEVNFIDGQALTPSSFGQTDPVTGVWQPLKYMGTYGTNGFYLPFSDNTSATTLAYDKSGNGNNWTPNNISTTAGETYDSMTDVPTLTSATAANYCVPNPLQKGSTISQYGANLSVYAGAYSATNTILGTIGVSSGKWYWECQVDSGATMPSNGTNALAQYGVVSSSANLSSSVGSISTGWGYNFDGLKVNNNSAAAYGAAFTAGDVIGIALDMDAGTLTFYKNGTSQGQAFSGLAGTLFPAISVGSNGASQSHTHANFGQRPFSYTPPTGFKALNTFNLPDPTIKKGNQYFDVSTWTGDNTGSRAIVNSGGMQPDLVWTKARSKVYSHYLSDTVRGVANKQLSSDSTGAETTWSIISAVNSNGFQITGDPAVNTTGDTYVAWQWKESATAGFDIVTFTNTASSASFNHSLGVTPAMIILKGRGPTAANWSVFHRSLANMTSAFLNLNNTNAAGTLGTAVPAPTSTTFGSSSAAIPASESSVAYLFSEIAGFSKFGSYTGNGSADGPFVWCGFRPRYLLVKNVTTGGAGYDWAIWDTSRSTYNVALEELRPDLSDAERTNGGRPDILSNGFKMRNTDAYVNASGQTYIYAAFAENPTKYANAR